MRSIARNISFSVVKPASYELSIKFTKIKPIVWRPLCLNFIWKNIDMEKNIMGSRWIPWLVDGNITRSLLSGRMMKYFHIKGVFHWNDNFQKKLWPYFDKKFCGILISETTWNLCIIISTFTMSLFFLRKD